MTATTLYRIACRSLLLGMVLLGLARGSAADPSKKLPPGMAKYVMVLWTPGMPLPDGRDFVRDIKEPDIEKHGGKLLRKHDNRREILLPKAAAKQLRAHEAVAYLQRIWMGEPPEEWAEEPSPGGPRLRVGTDSDTNLDWARAITYDGSGNIKQFGVDHYSYDSAGRLLRAEVSGKVETFKYDSFGNLTEKGVAGSNPVVIPVDESSNRLIGRETDIAGNVKTDGARRTYSYDSLNMLTRIHQPAYSRRYLYDANDEQIGMLIDSDPQARWTIRDFNGQVLREFSESGGVWEWQLDQIYAAGTLVAGATQPWKPPHADPDAVTLGGARHYHLDHLGSVRLVTDFSRRSIAEHDYYPFGIALTGKIQEPVYPGNPHIDSRRFAGHTRDFLGLANVENTEYLDYMHARYYDPNWGRFLSVDPLLNVKRALREPQSWNRYSYVVNNPINRVDPDGRVDQNWDGGMARQLFPDDRQAQLEFDQGVAEKTAVATAVTAGVAGAILAGPAGWRALGAAAMNWVRGNPGAVQQAMNVAEGLASPPSGATAIAKNSVIDGYSVSNHAWRKSGLGRGATEEMVSATINGSRNAGTVLSEVGTGKFQGNKISVYVHNGVKVAVDETRKIIMSIRPADNTEFKLK